MDVVDTIELKKHGFQKNRFIAQGSYGVVFHGVLLETGMEVAMKKMKRQTDDDSKEGIHFTTIRELKLLRELRHDNILGLVSVIVYQTDGEYCLWLISEFMPTTLENILRDEKKVLTEDIIKHYLRMILNGLEFLHLNWYLHRDLTPGNILMSNSGILKIADFGFTKLFGEDREMTPEVVTLWYRSPELLFGAKFYGTAVDIWSFGCILAQLLIKQPFLPGDNEIHQLATIFAAMGTPTEEDWPGMTKLPCYIEFEKRPLIPLDQLDIFRHANPDVMDLLAACLKFCPSKRCNASQALKHKYLINTSSF